MEATFSSETSVVNFQRTTWRYIPQYRIVPLCFFCDLFHDDINILNGRMIGEWWNGKDLEGSDCSLLEILSQHMPRVTEENYEKLDEG
jgi:hypothetical protein